MRRALFRWLWPTLLLASGCGGNTLPAQGACPAGDTSPPPLDAGVNALASGNWLPLDGGSKDDGGAAYGWLQLEVRDGDTGRPAPSRVIFRPVPGAGFADSLTSGRPNVFSHGSGTGAMVMPNVVGSNEGVLLVDGRGTVPVPPGHYTLVMTRGPEYELEERPVDICAGDTQAVTVTLERSVDTSGWLATDLHVHTSGSFDSSLVPERRVVSMVSNGVEVVVATDHNVATDLAPVAAALGYGPDVVGTIVGDEFNFGEGHGGAYPVPFVATAPGGGVPPYQNLNDAGHCAEPSFGINCLPGNSAFAVMHAMIPGTTAVTINHPFWYHGDLGYFTNVNWGVDTKRPLPHPLETAGHFDAMELLNGYQTNTRAESALLQDWFYLVNHGYRVTALGSSDTHKINWVRGGWPRTWLQLPVDRPGDVDGALLAAALKGGRAVASTGPFVTLTVDDAPIGATVKPRVPGQVTVRVQADVPRWIDVDEVALFVDGKRVERWRVHGTQRPRFAMATVLPVARDASIVAIASGRKGLPGDIVGECSEHNGYVMRPFAVTNPVYVDADGDGVWSSPLPPQGPSDDGGTTMSPELRPSRPPPSLPPPFDGRIGESCDPSESESEGSDGVGLEPPLDSPSHLVMPLLYNR